MPGAIDIVINLHTPEVLPLKPKWRKDFIGGKIGADAEILSGLPIEKYIERMDRAGIQMAFIAASRSGTKGHPSNWQLPYEIVADVVSKYRKRFKGLLESILRREWRACASWSTLFASWALSALMSIRIGSRWLRIIGSTIRFTQNASS